MTVTNVGGSFLTFGIKQRKGSDHSHMLQQYVLEQLSGWFCFAQTADGGVVSVFHSEAEDPETVDIKKGIAAAFQANFIGTAEEIETDPQSRHHSHYRYVFPRQLHYNSVYKCPRVNILCIIQLFRFR
jgi:hypothetical protein